MLAELCIENLVLIERARLELAGGLNAFTGETGAGKSLLVDGLALLFGARGDPDLVRPGAEAAEITARFELSDPELVAALREHLGISFEPIPPETPKESLSNRHTKERGAPGAELVLSRVVPREGRGRAYANGRPIALAALKELGERLIDIHGQHENQSLLRPATRLEILDHFGQAHEERAAVRHASLEARRAAEALSELRRAARDRQGREDLYRFQLKELEDARLDEMEPAALEGGLKLLRGAEKIRSAALAAAEGLDGEQDGSAAGVLARAQTGLASMGDGGAEAAALAERLEGLLAETRELARDLQHLAEKARSDPGRLADLEEIRAGWRTLERKHGRDLEGLRVLRDELRRNLSGLARIAADSATCEEELERALKIWHSAAEKLTRKRKAAAKDLEKKTAAELVLLGLPGSRFKVELAPHAQRGQAPEAANEPQGRGVGSDERVADEAARMLPPGLQATGAERAELLFSANPELPMKPLADCASGGELSRVMLALKGVLAKAGGADRLPVVVFDEVDSGVGGRLGAVLGRKLAALAKVRQVLCVTHLPQLAAYAECQIKVEKQRLRQGTEGSVITATALEEKDRIEELAMMLRGEAASDRTRAEAAEMLRAARGEESAAEPERTRHRAARISSRQTQGSR